MLNYIWLGLVVAAVLIAGFHTFIGATSGTFKEMTDKGFEMTKVAVIDTAFPLIGIMTLWLGIMRLAEKAGLVQLLARSIRPVMKWLFPDVPAEHPAMGSMLMNMAANFLGLSNAATPLGLRAMKDLETLNPRPGTASNAMCTFLAINTSSIQLLPVTAVAVLFAAGSLQPYAIIGTAIIATTFSTIAGITAVKLLEKLPAYRLMPVVAEPAATAAGIKPVAPDKAENATTRSAADPPEETCAPLNWFGFGTLVLFFAFFAVMLVANVFPEIPRQLLPANVFVSAIASDFYTQPWALRSLNTISLLAVPFMLAFFPLYAALRRVKVYEQFIEGAKEGFQVAVTIIPFLVAILVAVGLFRGAGGIAMLTNLIKPVLDLVHFPSELLPMCLMRPLSGGGTFGMFTELVKEFGADSLIARTAGTIYGSTETTFYVIAVYFGAVNVRRTRHAVPAGLIADLVGIIASVIICKQMFG